MTVIRAQGQGWVRHAMEEGQESWRVCPMEEGHRSEERLECGEGAAGFTHHGFCVGWPVQIFDPLK